MFAVKMFYKHLIASGSQTHHFECYILTLCILRHNVMYYGSDGKTSRLNEHDCVNTRDIWEDIPYFKQ